MKRILVISDNPKLAKFLISLIHEEQLDQFAKFDYRYSASSKSPEAMISLGFDPINVKDSEVIDALLNDFSLILSIHCKQVFPVKLVSGISCINLHPGLNPHNRGWYPQVFSIINKKPIGATLHIMTEEVDAGPVIAQEKVYIHSSDTSLSLYEKVQEVEIKLLRENLKSIIEGNIGFNSCSSSGNFNSLNDFKKLCILDINSMGTLGEHIDLLRALTHGGFNNAFFVDAFGEKIYVRIQLTPETSK